MAKGKPLAKKDTCPAAIGFEAKASRDYSANLGVAVLAVRSLQGDRWLAANSGFEAKENSRKDDGRKRHIFPIPALAA